MELRVAFEVLKHQDSSLAACMSAFLKTFSKPQQFRGAYVLLSLLQESLLSSQERVAAIFILMEYSKQEDGLFLFPLLEVVNRDPQEAGILQQLMSNSQLSDLPAGEILKRKPTTLDMEPQKKPIQTSIRPTANPAGVTGGQHLVLGTYAPDYLRPEPEFLDLWSDARWVDLGPTPEVTWIEDSIDTATTEFRKLYEQAIQSELRQDKADALLKALDADPNLLLQLSIDPNTFPPLVQRNTNIATSILIKSCHHELFEELTEKLIFMDLSVQQMEVMHCLLINAELPKSILPMFLVNSITTCRNIRDRSLQSRLARLLCVFISLLMKKRLLFPGEIPMEVTDFLKQFQVHKEVTELLKKTDRSQPQ